MKVIETNYNTEFNLHSSVFTIKKDAIYVQHYNGAKLQGNLLDRVIANFDRINAMQNYFGENFDLSFSQIENRPDTPFEKINEVLFYLAENFDDNWSKSPYSKSFYNSRDIDWGYKPEGSIRLSDHWNFEDSWGDLHCQTTDPEFKKGWALGVYHNGKYEITRKF